MAEVCGHLRVRADAAPLRGRKLRCRFADAEATAGAGADASVFVEVRRSSVAGAELMLGDAAADAPARVLDVTPLLREENKKREAAEAMAAPSFMSFFTSAAGGSASDTAK